MTLPPVSGPRFSAQAPKPSPKLSLAFQQMLPPKAQDQLQWRLPLLERNFPDYYTDLIQAFNQNASTQAQAAVGLFDASQLKPLHFELLTPLREAVARVEGNHRGYWVTVPEEKYHLRLELVKQGVRLRQFPFDQGERVYLFDLDTRTVSGHGLMRVSSTQPELPLSLLKAPEIDMRPEHLASLLQELTTRNIQSCLTFGKFDS